MANNTKRLMMANFYAVANGREKGIFTSWEITKQQVHKFKSAKYKSFKSLDDAVKWFKQNFKG